MVAAANETIGQRLPGKAFVDRFLDLRFSDGKDCRLSDLGWEFLPHCGEHLLWRCSTLVNLVRPAPSGTTAGNTGWLLLLTLGVTPKFTHQLGKKSKSLVEKLNWLLWTWIRYLPKE